jgi:4-amino-4-deoxy-L-arabinose transferase-like glycosyltransferase
LHPSTLAKRGAVLLFLVVLAFYFYGLGQLPFVGPDEPRYAQVAREMLLRHDLITPTLGGHTWFEKPALLYWMMIASFKLFGVSEWAARVPAAVSGVLTVAAVFVVGRRVERNDGDEALRNGGSRHSFAFWSALALATTLGFIVFSRAASFDIILTMTTTWALAFYLLLELEENARPRRAFLFGFYAFIGLSLLAKGLVGIVIPIGVVGLYHLFRRRLPERNAFISLFWGIPLALLVAAIWYAPVIWRHGWPFIDQFFIQHHFARYVSNKYHHWRPVYYYLYVIPLLALPWTAFLIDGLLQTSRWTWRVRASAGDRAEDRWSRLLVFALAWFLFPLLFFSFGNSKLPGYILPVLPAAALIAGERLWRLGSDSRAGRWPIRTTATLCLLFPILALAYAWRTGDSLVACAILMAAPLCVAGGFAFLLPRKPAASILLIAGATLAAMIVLMRCAAPPVAELESSKHLLQLADAKGYSHAVIYGMQRSDRTAEFYAAGRIVYGADGEPVMYEGPQQLIAESQRRAEVFLAFVPLGDVGQLTGLAPAQTDVIGNNGRYAIVAVDYQNRQR